MIKVVNMIPASLSGETNQDSEPNLTVNPANPLQMAATAFTPDPAGTAKAPIFVSQNGGDTWQLNATVPHGNTGSGTGDITLRFADTGGQLYTADLRGDVAPPATRMDVLRTANFAAATLMTQIESRTGIDQPWIQAATVTSGTDAGKDRVYVGNNDTAAAGGKTATIDFSLDAKAATPTFSQVRLEKRSTGTANQDGFQTRIAIHSSGVIYAAFYGWRQLNNTTGIVTADVVLVRDDSWGSGAAPFTALKDSADHLSGLRVVRNATFSITAQLGQNRLGGDLSIAVDPADKNKLYLVFGDQAGSTATLHVRRSTDGGLTWSADLLSVKNAVCPGIAINSSSEIGLLYQQVTGSGAASKWETHFRHSSGGLLWNDSILAQTPAQQPATLGQPYLGDYTYLASVGTDFFGVFCANNTPDHANFPNGVVYQRKANFTTKRLLNNAGTGNIAISIDPFFFKITSTAGTTAPTTPPTGTQSPTGTGTTAPSTGTPAPTGTGTPAHTGTPAPTGTGTPAHTGTPAPTGTGTPAHTGTPAPTGTGTPAHTGTPAPTGTGTPAHTGTPAPTGTGTPAHTGTPAPTGTGTPAHTGTPAPTGTGTPAPGGTGAPVTPTPMTHHGHSAVRERMLLAPRPKR